MVFSALRMSKLPKDVLVDSDSEEGDEEVEDAADDSAGSSRKTPARGGSGTKRIRTCHVFSGANKGNPRTMTPHVI